MATTIVVEHERQRFVWDGLRWYNELDYNVPRHALIQILDRLVSATARREMAIEAHQDFLSARGVTGGVTGRAKKSSHRATSCPNCRRKAPNALEVECAACHWIICACGACGCGELAATKNGARR